MEKKKKISFEIEHFLNEGCWIVRRKENGKCVLAPREQTLADALSWVEEASLKEQEKVNVVIINKEIA